MTLAVVAGQLFARFHIAKGVELDTAVSAAEKDIRSAGVVDEAELVTARDIERRPVLEFDDGDDGGESGASPRFAHGDPLAGEDAELASRRQRLAREDSTSMDGTAPDEKRRTHGESMSAL